MEKLIVIKTLEQLKELEIYLQDKEYVAVDTETTGLDKESEVIGISFSAEVEVGYYIICSYWDAKESKLVSTGLKDAVVDLLKLIKSTNLIMHNAVFDCWMIENNFSISLIDNVHTDTMLLAHLLDENRRVGLKDLAISIFGEESGKEQQDMRASVLANGGALTKNNYELYKADSDLIARYGAKDTILTLKLFYHLVPELYEQKLDSFFYEEETMPQLKGPTYELNTVGLRIDPAKLQKLKQELESECLEAKSFIYKEIAPYIKDKYPGTNKRNTFNIGSTKQIAWLLFVKLEQQFNLLTDAGKELCEALDLKLPYDPSAKRSFINIINHSKDKVYMAAAYNPKTKKMGRPKKVGDVWNYLACGKESLKPYSKKYKWVEKLLEYSKALKLLNTYVEGIQERTKYGVIRPSFKQHGTTSGRYSSQSPNFQNLPRDDKRVKSCLVAREGKVFVGADYSQLEPRVFASFSKDIRLLKCFADGDDFYSVIGADTFGKTDATMKKDDSPSSFPVKYKSLRSVSKVIALATPYGTTPPQMARTLLRDADIVKSREECASIIENYFTNYPRVEQLMLDSHEQAKANGMVYNLFGRPRRMPDALSIPKLYGKNTPHSELPYAARNTLNLAMNHRIQSTAASITNRAMIRFHNHIREVGIEGCSVVLMVHDEIIAECRKEDAEDVALLLKDSMENAVHLPGVDLIADPKIANNIGDLK